MTYRALANWIADNGFDFPDPDEIPEGEDNIDYTAKKAIDFLRDENVKKGRGTGGLDRIDTINFRRNLGAVKAYRARLGFYQGTVLDLPDNPTKEELRSAFGLTVRSTSRTLERRFGFSSGEARAQAERLGLESR